MILPPPGHAATCLHAALAYNNRRATLASCNRRRLQINPVQLCPTAALSPPGPAQPRRRPDRPSRSVDKRDINAQFLVLPRF